MGAFSAPGSNTASSGLLLSSIVALAALPALLVMALWRGDDDSKREKQQQQQQQQRRRRRASSISDDDGSSAGRKDAAPGAAAAAVVIVDPYSSGGVLARLAYDQGYQVVRVLSCGSQRMADQSLPTACQGLPFAATVVESAAGGPDGVLAELKGLGLTFAGFLCGAEPGVELFDALTSRWNADGTLPPVLSNGEALSAARRDKFPMSERVRAAGLRAVKQARATEWAQAEAFIKTELYPKDAGTAGGMAVILKPARSSSSEDVVLARSMHEARAAFRRIKGRKNQYGEENEAVLVQEYMKGTEYVVNCVSLNGQHKVVSLWRYDKRPANGAPFVYHGVRLFESADGRVEEALAQYIFGVLGALGVQQGPSHAEVMWLESEDAPCLVEIGCRPHGGDGVHTDLARRCIGYSQLDAMLGLLPGPGAEAAAKAKAKAKAEAEGKKKAATDFVVPFAALPPRQPRPLLAHAEVVMLVAYHPGRLVGYPGLPTLRALRSFWDVALKVRPGEQLHATIDYMTNPGWVMLVHEDPAVVAADAAAIHALAMKEEGGLYAVEAAKDEKNDDEASSESSSEDGGQTSEEEKVTPPASP